MFGKLSKNTSVKNILIVSLSNIGDVVLTAPVIDVLLKDFPQARISVIVSPKARSLFEGHARLSVIEFDKHMDLMSYVKWFFSLRLRIFDVIVDLRQSGLVFFLLSRFYTPLFPTEFDGHMRQKHLTRLRTVYSRFDESSLRSAIIPESMLEADAFKEYIVIAPGAADSLKRLDPLRFSEIAGMLIARGEQIIFVGDVSDQAIVNQIMHDLGGNASSLAGKTNLRQLAYVLKNAKFVLANDSGIMHLASYFDVPIIALWGPTDMGKYGPWSTRQQIVYKGKDMSLISVKDIEDAIVQIK